MTKSHKDTGNAQSTTNRPTISLCWTEQATRPRRNDPNENEGWY